jgi:hypothetical protein
MLSKFAKRLCAKSSTKTLIIDDSCLHADDAWWRSVQPVSDCARERTQSRIAESACGDSKFTVHLVRD